MNFLKIVAFLAFRTLRANFPTLLLDHRYGQRFFLKKNQFFNFLSRADPLRKGFLYPLGEVATLGAGEEPTMVESLKKTPWRRKGLICSYFEGGYAYPKEKLSPVFFLSFFFSTKSLCFVAIMSNYSK